MGLGESRCECEQVYTDRVCHEPPVRAAGVLSCFDISKSRAVDSVDRKSKACVSCPSDVTSYVPTLPPTHHLVTLGTKYVSGVASGRSRADEPDNEGPRRPVCRHTAKGKEELERSEERTAEGLHQHRFVMAKTGRGMKWQESSGPCAKHDHGYCRSGAT